MAALFVSLCANGKSCWERAPPLFWQCTVVQLTVVLNGFNPYVMLYNGKSSKGLPEVAVCPSSAG